MALIRSIKDLHQYHNGQLYEIFVFGEKGIKQVEDFLEEEEIKNDKYVAVAKGLEGVIFIMHLSPKNAGVLEDLAVHLHKENPDRSDFDALSAHTKALSNQKY